MVTKKRRKMTIKHCAICDKEIVGGGAIRYCDDCRTIKRKSKDLIRNLKLSRTNYYKEFYQKHKKKINEYQIAYGARRRYKQQEVGSIANLIRYRKAIRCNNCGGLTTNTARGKRIVCSQCHKRTLVLPSMITTIPRW